MNNLSETKILGKSVERWDAHSKVTGKAEYTADIPVKNMLFGKVVRATIAHGMVKNIDVSEALKIDGVVKIITADDVPNVLFSTAGHPYSLSPDHQDICDRNILTKHVRLYGDDIAAVIATNELAAEKAARLVKVEYEEFPFYLNAEDALKEGAMEIHTGSNNIIANTITNTGDVSKGFDEADVIISDKYVTQTVQHCHLENLVAYAYQDVDKRWVCVSSTQIPHICKRVLGQAFNMPWGRFRVVKPFIGGGFGNKQDINIEPIVVAMSMAVGGRPVYLELEREEVLANSRVRHAISYDMKLGLKNDGKITAIEIEAISNNGGYASHGHSVVVKGAGIVSTLYKIDNMLFKCKTVYTNIAVGGAMRGYGVPQITFALEALIEKAAKALDIDAIELRLANFLPEGSPHPLNGIMMYSNKVSDCVRLGAEKFEYYSKQKLAKEFVHPYKKRGVGLAAFSYATGVYPYSLEVAGARLTLNQDGSVKLMVGATEIGQGSDTVFKQMVAEVLGIDYNMVIADKNTDTDYAPFDPAAYASRQTYVGGMAVKKASLELKQKILACANKFYNIESSNLDLIESNIVYKKTGVIVEPLSQLALRSFYDIPRGGCLFAEVSTNFHTNSFPMGASFAELEVDTKTGKTEILSILNIHDSGMILNPILAEGQVEGGMGMGVSYCLSEELKYNPKNGAPFNNNLLDYKMPTFMDIPELDVLFVENMDPEGPFGNKGLGEPPLNSPAAAIRNAVSNAIGMEINSLPLSPQKIFEALSAKAGG